MELIFNETIFWLFLIVLNAILFLPNFAFNYSQSFFFPYVREFYNTKKLGLTLSSNLDPFRYEIVISISIICGRFINYNGLEIVFISYYLIVLFFNVYQYSFRKIYEHEPNFYNDSKLMKNGIAILWHEGKLKLLISFFLILTFIVLLNHAILTYLKFIYSLKENSIFYFLGFLWLIPMIKSIIQNGVYKKYPHDAHLRYHIVIVEIFKNIRRSILNSEIAKSKLGEKFLEKRQIKNFQTVNQLPNLHFIFIESYGSFFFLNPKKSSLAIEKYNLFKSNISKRGWELVSNFSQSPTVGGQSWLTYSTFLYGFKIHNNTYFENFLNDPNFYRSDSILKILQNHGYYNYNLNPIKPIESIQVPYEQMRNFYRIDDWILQDSLKFKGDTYGFGESPPDQYSINFAFEFIRKKNQHPYTFFYLTQSSHTPFISPEKVPYWQTLNKSTGKLHHHKGFLKQPNEENYYKAINYQIDILEEMILKWGSDNDIFFFVGDHQPPVLSNFEKQGFYTPVHVISKNHSFLEGFHEYGFGQDIMECKNFVTHEGLYSIFLREFIKAYGIENSKLPNYEPNGLQL